ncbi:hypothetical protein A244_06159, partial [Pseudomonas syringae pv. actinidiae ICMP 18807]
ANLFAKGPVHSQKIIAYGIAFADKSARNAFRVCPSGICILLRTGHWNVSYKHLVPHAPLKMALPNPLALTNPHK